MKTPLPEIKPENPITAPRHPTGYTVYYVGDNPAKLAAKLTHMDDVRATCKKLGLTPFDVAIFRTYSDDKKTLLHLPEYSYLVYHYDTVGPMLVKLEWWTWDDDIDPSIKDEDLPPKTSIFIRIGYWLSNTFSFLKYI